MQLFSIVMAAVAPGVALLAYFYLKDRYDTEPIHLVIKLFLFGFLLVIPTMVLQRVFVQGFGDNSFLFAFVISAGLEEFLKWFLVFFLIYRHTSFDEPYDGIVYAVAVSLGFATLENIIYAMLNFTSFSQLLIRAFLPVSGHAMFGVLMGFHIGKARFDSTGETKHLIYSLAIPIFWHGLFDYILLMYKTQWAWFMIPLMTYLWIRSIWKVNRANNRSPFRALRRDDEVKI
jgi:RsiW-degrading membrane proteinase PrsW (M82 family)